MSRIAVVGSGLVGSGWAIVFARAGHNVAIYDADHAAAEAAMIRIKEILPELAARDLLEEPESHVLARLRVASSLDVACDGVEYVQESGPEKVEVKREIFAQMADAAPDAILATSSSGIPVSRFCADLDARARCLVAHPVNPPYLVPVVEIVPAPWTATDVVSQTHALMEAIGQVPIILKREIDGFVLNRLQGALLHEAFRLVEDGVADPEDIDKTVRDGLGLRWSFMGPFETIDLNAPNGVDEYVARLGSLYLDLAEQRGAPKAWNAKLVAQVTAARRRELAKADIETRAAWRDRRLMDLNIYKTKANDQEDVVPRQSLRIDPPDAIPSKLHSTTD
jgi:L-gulonate 3-dehydrogenase